jgi:hypothetical protein
MTFARSEVARISKQFGCLLHLQEVMDDEGKPVDLVQVMWAFAGNESSFGHNTEPRFEAAYWDGKYSHDPHQEVLNNKYGKLGASSFGIFQIMLCNVHGSFTPAEFSDIEKNACAFVGFMNRQLDRADLRGTMPRNLDELADMYNSGNCRDSVTPQVAEYIARFRHNYYNEVLG